MEIVCFPNGVNGLHPKQGIRDLKDAGFRQVVLDFAWINGVHETNFVRTTAKAKKEVRPRTWLSEHPQAVESVVTPYIEALTAAGFSQPIAFAPYVGWLKEEAEEGIDLTDLLTEFVEACLQVAGRAGCHAMAVRPLIPEIIAGRDLWEANREYLLRLAATARPLGIKLLLRSASKGKNGRILRGVCADEAVAAQWIDDLNAEAGADIFGYCLNVGLCNVFGQNMYDVAVTMGKRLKAVILADSSSVWGGGMLPFSFAQKGQSQTDWLNLVRGLRKINFDGDLIMSCGDTVAAFSPLLRPEVLKLAKKTADYIAWQVGMEQLLEKYSVRVLFGAGNMCRNYLKSYGEKYPPLFTCDNNSALWGKKFCGLEVRSPESLRDLPEGCAVFICNTYYREIEHQLREMGIKNPVEFFNDEYMPTFPFARLEELEEGSVDA